MADRLSMSLDDIIKQSKTERKSERGGGRGGGRGASRGGNRGGGQGQQSARGGRDGGRPRGGGGAGGSNGATGGRGNQNGGGVQGKGVPEGGAKIRVTGVASSVSSNDLKELFSQVGPVMNVNLQAGTGTVIFARANDAVKAKKKYDRVTLDNRPMSIEVVQTKPQPETTRQANNRNTQSTQRGAGRGGRGGGGRGGGGGGRGRGKREEAPIKTKEELDAELDAYGTTGDGAEAGAEE